MIIRDRILKPLGHAQHLAKLQIIPEGENVDHAMNMVYAASKELAMQVIEGHPPGCDQCQVLFLAKLISRAYDEAQQEMRTFTAAKHNTHESQDHQDK